MAKDDAASIIKEAMVLASNDAFLVAIEICRSMPAGTCNECCAKAIDDMRRKVRWDGGEVTH